MQISLRTICAASAVVVVLCWWGVREYRMRIPDKFPVTYSTTQLLDVDVPKEVLVWRNPAVRRATIAAEKSSDNAWRKYAPTDDDALKNLLNEPSDVSYLNDQQRRVIAANRELFLAQKTHWFSDTTNYKTLVGAAHVLAVLDDRSGFDLAIKRLPSALETTVAPAQVVRLAICCPKSWAAESKELVRAARHIFDTTPSYRQSLLYVLERSGDLEAGRTYHLSQAQTPESIYHRTSSLQWLTKNAPSDKVFSLVESHFGSPNILSDYDASQLLEDYLKLENPNWHSKSLELAMRLASTPRNQRGGYPVYPYHRLICTYGGQQYVDYFKQKVKTERCQYAMRALERFLPRPEYLQQLRQNKFLKIYLDAAGDHAIPFLREQFSKRGVGLDLIANYQAGSKDAETIALIQKRLASTTDYFAGLSLIDALEKLGAEVDRAKLIENFDPPSYDRTDPYATETHWIVNGISNEGFLHFVTQYAVKSKKLAAAPESATTIQLSDLEELTSRTAACRMMAAAGIAKEFVVDEYDFESIGRVARDISSLLADDFPFDSVSFEPPRLRFATSGLVFEVALNDTHSWYDPVAVVDVLNSILDQHSESPKRLYCFDMAYDWCYVTVAYLDEAFVEQLGKQYAVYPLSTKRIRLNQQK